MNFIKTISLLFLFTLLFSCKNIQPVKVQTPENADKIVVKSSDLIVANIGKESVNEQDLISGLETFLIEDSTSFKKSLDEFLTEKQFSMEARSLGYHLTPDFQDQINTFKKVLSKDFLADTVAIHDLVLLSYDRLHTEINASHILFPLPEDALPNDTLKVFQEVLILRNQIANGAKFDSLATLYSGDINTKNRGGDMGWISALQLIFPLENAAYSTAVGDVSQPFRTNAGYHLLKVNAKRPYRGVANAAHLLIAVPNSADENMWQEGKNKIDLIYKMLNDGKSFESLCEQYSDDYSNREKGGILDPFSTGQKFTSNFEESIFALKPGEFSSPVKTEIGWHLIKLISFEDIKPLNKIHEDIKARVVTDSRGQYLNQKQQIWLNEKLQVRESPNLFKILNQISNPNILEKKWDEMNKLINSESLISIGSKNIRNEDFGNFILDRQSFDNLPDGYKPEMMMYRYYKIYKNNLIKKTAIENLEFWNSDFQNLIKIYEQNWLASSMTNDLVYEKSIADTTGQRNYYLNTLENYNFVETADVQFIKSKNKDLILEFQKIESEGKPYRLKRGIAPVYFTKNNFELNQEDKRRLAGLVVIMLKNPGYLVEIGGHSDGNEVPGISKLRMKAASQYLIENGLKNFRIIEKDFMDTRMIDKFDWSKNQRLSFQFFSNTESDIIKMINLDGEKDITFEEKNIRRDQDNLLENTEWKIGEKIFESNGQYELIKIRKINPARPKTLKEARTEVILGYQNKLMTQLKERLSVKYPIKIDNSLLETLYLQNFKQ